MGFSRRDWPQNPQPRLIYDIITDIILRTKCVEYGFESKDNKLMALSAWVGHPGGWWNTGLEKKSVSTFQISPTDWTMDSACNVIKDLKYEFKLGSNLSGGTWDKLSFKIGQRKKILLGESVSRGFSNSDSIHVEEIFNLSRVKIGHIQNLSIVNELGKSKNSN